ncbi:MAG: PIN domain-containing protein [Deltaproteobacteria bacterium]|nr:PIN domain-containing protein [Deltaproteobacteria bacterium]MBW2632553.1 PIN domain-containing protein [Deltaproteobacteria bacterium]
MKVLFDTNIVLDLMLDREPFSKPAAILFSMVESGTISGLLSATTITTIHYLAAKVIGKQKAEIEITKLLSLFKIAAVNQAVLSQAIQRNWPDFEDAVVYEAALQSGAEAITTRDLKGFKDSRISILTPEESIQLLSFD